MAHTLHSFDTGAALATALAERVAAALNEAIAASGAASLAVSGGSTPKAFFEALSQKALDWDKVSVTLVDERFVPEDNPRSNHLLVATHLLKNQAAEAEFVPLYAPEETIEAAAAVASDAVSDLGTPLDVVILGMGTDGHTASFFPGGDNLEDALDLTLPPRVITMQAPGAGEPRLTLSFSSLADAGLLIVHIEGAEKKTVLDKALAGTDETEMPVRAVLARAETPVDIYWAP
ncbi:6-phosphogluconolactonase [Agrobacterium vitis]|uniref:6-phosphogluconolactonase n=1 Tax=Agrobacterium vitis TaxID=373 RepID=UPI0015722E2B|nr:6-phosphogluconolactonase [Agrobacterium vitis]NSZ15745.1 6-phosphogluconolactonase [Agrobacterium vitis]QZO04557.1 6-phosphogluconolactonase [Agrobacterium vitis]UJL86700.1 6-phosphogluconolactonase [Agrobacterium vitis]